MKTHHILTTSVALILMACNKSANYRDATDFKICDTCVKENEPIQIIHRTQGPINNKNFEFYYHMVGITSSISEESGQIKRKDLQQEKL